MTADERFDRVDGSLERPTQYILDMRQETAARLQAIDNRLDILSSTVSSLDRSHFFGTAPVTSAWIFRPISSKAARMYSWNLNHRSS